MANVSVTYTFTNGTTADADEVNTNFSDIIAGTSDGTKDFSIAALTVAGTATLNGDVTLGNSSGDDITITGSIAADIPFKTNATYDVGAAGQGPALIYLGSGSNTLALGVHSSISSNISLQLPHTAGSDGDQIMNVGSGNMVWQPNTFGFTSNIGLAVATTTNANDSIKITGSAAALSATNPGYVVTTSTTTGLLTTFKVTADVTIDLTGAHWGFGGQTDLTDYVLHVLALNNDGSLVWGIVAQPGRSFIANTDDDTSGSNITSSEKCLVNSALSADAQALHVGYFKANFDDTGGAAEDLWAVQNADGDLIITQGRVPETTPWIDYGATTISGSSSAPTKANTQTIEKTWFRRVGDSMHFRYTYEHQDNTGAANGSGTYLFELPLSLSRDSNKINTSTPGRAVFVIGTGYADANGVIAFGFCHMYDATHVSIVGLDPGTPTQNLVGSTFYTMNNAIIRYCLDVIVPIEGWGVY